MQKNNIKQLRIYRALWILFTFLSICLISYMVIAENEPGLLPILLVIAGTIGLLYTQRKIKNHTL